MWVAESFQFVPAIETAAIAALIFLAVQMLILRARGKSPLWALRPLAAMFVGKRALSEEPLGAGPIALATVVQLLRTLPSGIFVAMATFRLATPVALPAGALVGAFIYGAIYAFYGPLGLGKQRPVADVPRAVSFMLTTYVVFGFSAAAIYKLLA